ncbi:hypothetical protein N7530_002234 [Penicillium desertorum]|uniref:Uncharacterized protein n=1 Tax=Penicillium desertorum TaxID=1303715 RepID=A0A9X0BX29_9EURO|nr:hypothetical protein N7530_002234 [Penicillium desertorum]
MKFTSVVVAVLAAGTVQAAALAPSETLPKWCGHIGQGCKRTTDASLDVKRSADALAEAMAGGLPLSFRSGAATSVRVATRLSVPPMPSMRSSVPAMLSLVPSLLSRKRMTSKVSPLL